LNRWSLLAILWSALPRAEERALFSAVLDQLIECGWISEWGFHGDSYALKWTLKGRELSKSLKQIDDEMQFSPLEMGALMALCKLHAPR
jgi:hypothetical protein